MSGLTDFELARFLFAVVLLLAGAHTIGYALQRLLGIPKVIGEIACGLLLGPTLLGNYFPGAYEAIFNAFPTEGQLLSSLYWLGLILLMFISGFEVEKSVTKKDRRIIGAILLGSTIIPFAAGWIAANLYDFTPFLGDKGSIFSLQLIIATAAAITSIPVISKIFMDLGILDTRFAKIVLSSATVHDVLLWVVLAIATGVASGAALNVSNIALHVVAVLGFFIFGLLVMPRILAAATRSRFNLIRKSSASGYALLVCLTFALVASVLDVNIIFGAFLAGIVLGRMPNADMGPIKSHIKEVSLGFFVPIYFAIVGLKLDLVQHFDVAFFAGFLLFTSVAQIAGTMLAARVMSYDLLSCFNLGIAMNARGGPGIVLATVAFEAGIINQTFFSALVVIAIVTSLMTGFWLKFVLNKKWPLLAS